MRNRSSAWLWFAVLLALGCTPEPTSLTWRVEVIDDQGKPVPDAQLVPTGFGTEPGNGYSLQGGKVKFDTTDLGNGVFQIVTPSKHDESLIDRVYARVEHPNYVTPYQTISSSGEAPNRVALQRGTRLKLGIANSEGKLLPLDTFLLLPTDRAWSQTHDAGDGWWTTSPLPPEESVLFAMYQPPGGDIQFSPPHTWKPDDPATHQAILKVAPGVPLRGRFSDEVPRPIQKGAVFVSATRLGPAGENGFRIWSEEVRVNEDGESVIPSLPAQSHVQVLARCEGYLSAKPSIDEMKRFPEQYRHDLSAEQYRIDPNSHVTSAPFIPLAVELGENRAVMEVPMRKAYEQQIAVRTAADKPVADAVISAWPNVNIYGGGSTVIFWKFPSARKELSLLKRSEKESNEDWLNHLPQDEIYRATTNASGIAVLRNLPEGTYGFVVEHPNWQLPISRGFSSQNLTISGDGRQTLTVEPKR